jgi:multidrug efflux pump subunit AcrA (membrane-fusion protein)
MRKFLSLFIPILLAVVILFTAALLLIPHRVETLWLRAGLPAETLSQMETLSGQVSEPQETRLYGALEARVTHVMSELNGRAVAVLVDEGAAVVAGQPLIRLDPTDARAQIAAAGKALRPPKPPATPRQPRRTTALRRWPTNRWQRPASTWKTPGAAWNKLGTCWKIRRP